MTRPEEVNNFVTAIRPAAVCNKCIAKGLGWANDGAHPAQITGALATTRDFTQAHATCSICQIDKLVIRAT